MLKGHQLNSWLPETINWTSLYLLVVRKEELYKGNNHGFHSKGKSVCRGANLIKKEIVEEKVFKEISFLVNNGDVLNALIKELGNDNEVAKEAYQAEIILYKKQQTEEIEKLSKLDEDYFKGTIKVQHIIV